MCIKQSARMLKLGVNIDHLATLREARRGSVPDIVSAARVCERSGANSIVVHLREDRRHIKDSDVVSLKGSVKTKFNLEMSIASDIVQIACRVRPDQATLVPEKRRELTTEGGLDVAGSLSKVKNVVSRLQESAIEVSIFIDPDKRSIDAAKKAGAGIIELHTGRYADAGNVIKRRKHLREIKSAVSYAQSIGLAVNAGHGLNYENVREVRCIHGIGEFNIGYAIICRAVIVGLGQAVKEMKALVS